MQYVLGLERTFFIPEVNVSENFMSRIGKLLNMFQKLNHPDIIKNESLKSDFHKQDAKLRKTFLHSVTSK